VEDGKVKLTMFAGEVVYEGGVKIAGNATRAPPALESLRFFAGQP
jgi:hypothetical protein